MKLGILSESPADEEALAVLVAAVVGEPIKRLHPPLRARGWPHVAQVLPIVIRHLHFNTDAEALVVCVDADDSVVHTEAHEAPSYFHPKCRLCELRAIVRQTTKRLPAAHGRASVLRCIGVATPAIEAWYLCGRHDGISEQAWIQGQARNELPYTRRELKQETYGTDRPNLRMEIEIAVREAERHARDLRRLEHDFLGFALLAADLRKRNASLRV